MAEWGIEASGSIVDELRDSFLQGPIIDEAGNRVLTEHTVDRFAGMKIEVFSNEHPPPHFRVTVAGENNCFRIDDGLPLYDTGLSDYYRNIRKWHKKNKSKLIQAWNDTRPDDCPVGKIVES